MKKTFNINLSGYPFTIDEDAYNLLKDYLDTIRYAFETSEDTGEIAADIEARIAEILIEKDGDNRKIITLNEISSVIERIGKPSDFIEVEETVSSDTSNNNSREKKIEIEGNITPPPLKSTSFKNSRNPFVRKNLFRDPQNAMLGGVCSGLAVYLGIDVTFVRLIAILLLFLSFSTMAIVYIILWIVVPEARTPLQRMKMMGEDPTVENIGKTVTENYQDNDSQFSNTISKESNGFLSNLFSIFIKCLVILGLIISIPLLFALGIGLVGCIIAVFVLGIILIGDISVNSEPLISTNGEELFALYILLAVIGGIITIGIPLYLVLRSFWKKKEFYPNPVTRRIILIIWLCGIAILSVFTVISIKTGKHLTAQRIVERLEKVNDLEVEGHSGKVCINPDGITITDNNGKNVTILGSGGNEETKENVESEKAIENIDSIKTIVTEDSIR